MNNPLVSILIPCYNSEAYLAETLKCCVNQTYPNIEVVVVDDGSTDGSLKIAHQWKGVHENICVYSQQNLGAASARNFAFEKSRGEYIMYLDADDLISLNKVEKQVESLEGG